MKTIPEIRQALASAVDKAKTASTNITTTKAALRTADAAGKDAAAKAVADAEKAYADAHQVAKDLGDELERAVSMETMAASGATPRSAPEGTFAPLPAVAKGSEEVVKMAPVRRMIADIMVRHSGGELNAEKWLGQVYGEDTVAVIQRSMNLSNYAAGGALSLPEFAAVIIEGLDNMTVVRRMSPQVLNVPGTMILPKETQVPNGAWTGENTAPTPGEFKFGDIRLDPKRLPIEAVISRRLLDQARNGGAAVRNLEGYIVRRLRERLAVNEDSGFLRGGGTEYVPLGLRSQIAAGNVFAISGTDSASIETDLRKAVTRPKESNIIVTNGYWVMAPRTVAKLADLRDPNGNKIYASIDISNTLLRCPIIETNQVPTNLSGSNTEIMFFNGPSIIVANGSDAEVVVDMTGGYVGADGKSYFLTQTNEILIHMELYADCKLERPEAGSCITGVSY
ncbi:phage major capsid protein [Azospirillum sp. HJ39]|uniref:phage major capsid protein n=1 Tax=Azospirillum sp. HJ39 TaxID=3159496 RepID=UPI003556FA4F